MEDTEILVDELEFRRDAVSDSALSDLLSKYVRIRVEDYLPIPQDNFDTLAEKQQLLVALLTHEYAARADGSELGIPAVSLFDQFELSCSEYYPYLRELEQEGTVKRRDIDGGTSLIATVWARL